MEKVAIIIICLILAMIVALAGCTTIAHSVGALTPAPKPVSVTDNVGSKEVSLEAYIMPAIDLAVDPSSIDFDTSEPHTVTITNNSAWDLLVTCNVTRLYVDGLRLDGEMWSLFNATIKRNGHQEIDVTLTVPENYTKVGK